MKRIIFILTFFLLLLNPVSAVDKINEQEISVISNDGFNIKATLSYPKDNSIKEFRTIVLLHSLGYNSEWWFSLPEELLDNGYAVLKIDLRGHGKSIYNKKLKKISWKDLANTAYAKYPDDVIKVIEQVKTDNTRKIFFNEWAIVGADVGASSAILAAEKIAYKPKTIVLLSPGVNIKGLYLPIKLAHLNNIDILSISGKNDFNGQEAEKYLKRFAQDTFATYVSDSNSNGMMLIKSDKTLSKIILSWIKEYL